jgi:predicted ester cyclase
VEQNKQVVRKFLEELFDKQRLHLVDDLLAPDYKLYHPGAPEPLGLDSFPEFLSSFPAGFAGFYMKVEDLIGEGDKVAARFVLGGTHKGVFMGVQPTGKVVELHGEAFYLLRDGQIVEDRPLIDWAQMLEQMEIL